jgi:hypothetical protein
LYFVDVVEAQRVHLMTVLPVWSVLEWNSMTWLGGKRVRPIVKNVIPVRFVSIGWECFGLSCFDR